MRYEAPETFEAAVALLAAASGEARVLAGGTDLLVQLRAGLIEPELVVDIKGIPEVHEIRAEQGGFRIGAAVSGAELGEHPEVKKMWPGVVEAVELIGSTQIQGRATMVGNMCNASPAADSVPALIAAGALVRIIGPGGTARAAGRGDVHRARARPRSKRARSSPRCSCRSGRRAPATPICASSRAPRWTSRWSAPGSA